MGREDLKNLKISSYKPSEIEKVGKKSLTYLGEAEKIVAESGFVGGIIYFLSETEMSIRELEKFLRVRRPILTAIYDHFSITKKTPAEAMKHHWTKPEFREKIKKSQEGKINLEGLRRPETRAKAVASMKITNARPEVKAKLSERMKKLWQKPEHREKMSQKTHEIMTRLWQDPEFREKNLSAQKKNEKKRIEKSIETNRKRRESPKSSESYPISTIQGFRRDIDYYAKSSYEANIARVFICLGREFYHHETFILKVPDKFKQLFSTSDVQCSVDFIVEDRRGNLSVYELMAHPIENPFGLAKIEMLREQHPELKINVIDEKKYTRIQKRFRRRINKSGKLCGWEDYKSNLRNDPEKYS